MKELNNYLLNLLSSEPIKTWTKGTLKSIYYYRCGNKATTKNDLMLKNWMLEHDLEDFIELVHNLIIDNIYLWSITLPADEVAANYQCDYIRINDNNIIKGGDLLNYIEPDEVIELLPSLADYYDYDLYI